MQQDTERWINLKSKTEHTTAIKMKLTMCLWLA